MGKYTPLGAFLKRWRRQNHQADTVDLSFAEVERIIGAMLPRSATFENWWSNEPSARREHVQCQAWLDAGFEASLLAGNERVRFRKVRQ